ncbi:uncharacterized protein TRUGW13939_04449 [Talaromyces rugulosus]|uniref:Uncharacterized protein n=1 Tax=Talaromyces rugulosus TaxID=121627 RepID=A0A7H8QTP1_TALRU|nr:uncharacterized protein TRUGW13939_04449 [Talaromyces rugulosus]QKX57337.1 hypothetical protein TRUGW13939_04449 [Talaromyces rugulosus]
MKPVLLQSILSCCLLFLGYCYAQSIPPITSEYLPPVPTTRNKQDYIEFLESFTYNILESTYSDELSAIATVPPPESLHYCMHFSGCPEISGDPNVAPSNIGTVIGPHYPPGYDLQQLISLAKEISKQVAITTHTTAKSKHPKHSKPATVTVTAAASSHPYTQTRSDWNVIACDKYTVISGRNFDYKTTSCIGPSKTISSVKPQVTVRMDATPCNWGTMSSTDIYTSISSALMDACRESPVPTSIRMVPKNSEGIFGLQPFNTTMSACNPKTMTIKDVDGPAEEAHGHWQKKSGEILFTADKNFFDMGHLEDLVNTSAHFVAKSATSNPLNLSFIDEAPDWSGVEISYYHEVVYSANSTELNWYDPGYTEYTQAFIVDYTWEETFDFPWGTVVCDLAQDVGDSLAMEIPELAPIIELTVLLCDIGEVV